MRLKNYYVAPDVMLWMLQQKHATLAVRIAGGPPVGSRLRSATLDHVTGCVVLTVEHETFEDVQEGCPIPAGEPTQYQCVTVDPDGPVMVRSVDRMTDEELADRADAAADRILENIGAVKQ